MASMASVATMASMAVFPPQRPVSQGYPAAAQSQRYSDDVPLPPPPTTNTTTTTTTLLAPMGFDLVAPTEYLVQADAALGTILHNHHGHGISNQNMHNDHQLQEETAAGRARTKTPADRLRLKQARAERNRASAERSRIKKRLSNHAVSEKVTHLESENSLLKDRVQQLATVLRSLQRIVNPE